MKVGAGYTEHCVVYQCQNIDGMVEFRPVQTGTLTFLEVTQKETVRILGIVTLKVSLRRN